MELRIAWEGSLWAMLLAFVLSMAIAWAYIYSYQGLSYSRGFVQTIALGGVVSALIMLAIGNDIARGLGLVGALTVIRFRSTLKDTRDLMFVFASLAVGVGCGVQAFSVALMGTIVFTVAAIFVSWSGFGSRRHFDAVIRMQLPLDADEQCKAVMKRHCKTFTLINLRDMGSGGAVQEHSYHVKLANPDGKGQFVFELNGVPGLRGVTLLMQDTTIET